jgi:ATP synthase I subunit
VSAPAFLERLQRNTLISIAVLTGVAFFVKPTQPRIALGVVGGGLLIGLSYWGLRALVDAVARPADFAKKRPSFRVFALVKFFTRHAILALAAYGMMARLELHPIGLLIGVSAPGVAAAVEALRARRH